MQTGDMAQLTLFSLILMRMSGFILFNPIFGRKNIPMMVKSGFIMILTFAVYSFSQESAFVIDSPIEHGFLLIKEFAAGYVLGFVMDLFLFVISYAGHVMDFQLGLSMAAVYDPQSNSQMPVTGNLIQTYFILLFWNGRASGIDEDFDYLCGDCSLWGNLDYARVGTENTGYFLRVYHDGIETCHADYGGRISYRSWNWNFK